MIHAASRASTKQAKSPELKTEHSITKAEPCALAKVLPHLTSSEFVLFNIMDCLLTENLALTFYCREYWGTCSEDVFTQILNLKQECDGNSDLITAVLRCEVTVVTLIASLFASSKWPKTLPRSICDQAKRLTAMSHACSLALLDLSLQGLGNLGSHLKRFLVSSGRLPLFPPQSHLLLLRRNLGIMTNLINKLLSTTLKPLASVIQESSALDPLAARIKLLSCLEFKPIAPSRFTRYTFHSTDPLYTCEYDPLPPMVSMNAGRLLPPATPRLTVVLDLDETLIRYEEGSDVKVRPGCLDLLSACAECGCELVVWTAATEDYGTWVLDGLERHGAPKMHRLFRHHAMPCGPVFLKDLSRLGRNLDRCVIVDNMQVNFALQSSNGIWILSWMGDPADRALHKVLRLVRELASLSMSTQDFLRAKAVQLLSISGVRPSR